MAKTDVVSDAVFAQLKADTKPTDDVTKVMGKDLHYSEPTMDNFLEGVQQRLKANVPSYAFVFPPPSPRTALTYSIARLMGVIDGRTT